MARKVRAYTDIGFRISALGRRQRQIAKVLRVSQQTVSKKLRGETAILLSDLQRLASHYDVPMTYFFEQDAPSAELSAAFERAKKGPTALKDLVVLLGRLPAPSVERVLELATFIGQGAKGAQRVGKGARAAEEPGRYGR